MTETLLWQFYWIDFIVKGMLTFPFSIIISKEPVFFASNSFWMFPDDNQDTFTDSRETVSKFGWLYSLKTDYISHDYFSQSDLG